MPLTLLMAKLRVCSHKETRNALPTKFFMPLEAHRLDQDPREEAGDDSGGAMGVEDGETRGHMGDIDTLR